MPDAGASARAPFRGTEAHASMDGEDNDQLDIPALDRPE
jgi:hypothetical protein